MATDVLTVGKLIALLKEQDSGEIVGFVKHPEDDFAYLAICPGDITKTLLVVELPNIVDAALAFARKEQK
jgi:hypothetical protein